MDIWHLLTVFYKSKWKIKKVMCTWISDKITVLSASWWIINVWPSLLPVAHVDYVTRPDVLLLHFTGQVQTAHGHQVGFICTDADTLKEMVVQYTCCSHGNRAHFQLHSWEREKKKCYHLWQIHSHISTPWLQSTADV